MTYNKATLISGKARGNGRESEQEIPPKMDPQMAMF